MLFLSRIIIYLVKLPNKIILKKKNFDEIKFGDFCNFKFYPKAQVEIGKRVDIRNNCSILVSNNAVLSIKDGFFMNNFCSINCLEKIIIEENVLFGEGVRVYDHNHQYGSFGVKKQDFNTGTVKIGKNCWLGSNVVVLKGVTIGDNVIIGAGCTIYKDIPANSIVINKQELVIKNI